MRRMGVDLTRFQEEQQLTYVVNQKKVEIGEIYYNKALLDPICTFIFKSAYRSDMHNLSIFSELSK